MTNKNVIRYDDEVGSGVNTPRKKSSSYEICEDVIREIVHMRQYNNISQNELAAMRGVKQPMIARIEHGINTPNMSTILKLLAAFGKTLSIVDIQDENIRSRNAK